MTTQYTREQLNAAVWEATGGNVASALEIAAGWPPDAIEDFAAPLRDFVDGLDRLARSRR